MRRTTRNVLRLEVDAMPRTFTQDGAPAWRGHSVPHHTAAGGGRWYYAAVFFKVFFAITFGLFGLWFFALLVAYIMVP